MLARQEAPAASWTGRGPQSWLTANEVDTEIDESAAGLAPGLLSATTCTGVVVFIDWPPKLRNAGLAAMPPATVVNVAVAALGASIVTMHVPVPAQAPLQLPNAEPTAGTAVSVTTVPLA